MTNKFYPGLIHFLVLLLMAGNVLGQNVGVNNTNPLSTLDVIGSFGNNIRVVSANATISSTDATVLASPGITLTLPASSTTNRRIIRIVFNGSIGASAVTIKPAGTDHVISNNSSYSSASGILLSIGSIDLQTDAGGNWYATMNLGGQSGVSWILNGNSGTSYSNFLGSTDNVGLNFNTNNVQRMHIDSLGRVSIGSNAIASFDPANPEKFLVDNGTNTDNSIATFTGSINDYLQINVRNKNSGINASSDYVATADNGTDSTDYIDMGINSSTYTPAVDNFGGPNDGYLYTYSRNLVIGTEASSSDVIFLISGGSIKNNTALRLISPSRNIVIGKGEATNFPVGNVLRGPNASTFWPNIAGGSLTIQGGSSTGTAIGGAVNITGGTSATGTPGAVNINASSNFPTNIGTGTTTQNVSIGGGSNNILFPGLSTAGGVTYTTAATGQIGSTAAGTSGQLLISNGASSPSWGNVINVSGTFSLTRANITVPSNSYIFNDLSNGSATYLEFTAAGTYSFVITGIAAGSDGELMVLWNKTAGSMTLKGFNPGSASANQFWMGAPGGSAGNSSQVIPSGGNAILIYNSYEQKWDVAEWLH